MAALVTPASTPEAHVVSTNACRHDEQLMTYSSNPKYLNLRLTKASLPNSIASRDQITRPNIGSRRTLVVLSSKLLKARE